MYRLSLLCVLFAGCTTSTPSNPTNARVDEPVDMPTETEGATKFVAEVWADNWFAMYLGEDLIAEDSVPITTERSFNAEVFSFEATYPLRVHVVVKDFKENDTGLEYIGQPNQQMGDGGLILQIREESGGIVAVTDASWRCLPIHRAPLNKECEDSEDPATDCQFESLEEPEGWKTAAFDANAWPQAVVHSAEVVRPKDGYDQIQWDATASLIWTSDLEVDNTLLCSTTIEAP